MHPQIPMIRTAVQTQINAKRHTAPGRVLGAAVEADLVGGRALQLLEQAVRLRLRCQRHRCGGGGIEMWCS